MAKTIFDPATRDALFARMDKLTDRTAPRWGILEPNQMVRHLREALRVVNGDITPKDQSTFMTRTLMRWMVLAGMVVSPEQAKKRPAETVPDINVVKKPIPADDLATEKRKLREFTDQVLRDQRWASRSPVMGRMQRSDWGKYMYSHMHWHLTQFGV